MGLITGTTTYEEFGDVDFVVEAVPEKMEIKKAVYRELDEVTPGTRSSPPTPPRSRSPRWAARPSARARSSASTSSTPPR